MGNRIIRESICTSDTIDKLSWFEEVIFYRLVVSCDDFGRYDGRASIIKNRLFPLKENLTIKTVDNAIAKLANSGLITLYCYEGKTYLFITNWDKYQRKRSQFSKFPSPDEGMILSPDSNLRSIDSNLQTDDSNPQTDVSQMLSENTRIRGNEDTRNREIVIAGCDDEDSLFDSLWTAYPKKKNKQGVTARAKKELKAAGAQKVLRAIENYKAEIQRKHVEDKYIMYGSTFFNGRWRDYVGDGDVVVNGDDDNLPFTMPVGRPLNAEECEKLGIDY